MAKEPKAAPELFRCAHCTWTTRKWRATTGGKRISGWRDVEIHMVEEHDIEVDLSGEGEDD